MWKVARSFMVAAVAAVGFVITYAPVSAQLPPCDFISAGGFVVTNAGAEANFGADGGCKRGAFWGSVNYVDHGGFLQTTPYHVSSIAVTGYIQIAPNVRDICGMAETNADELQPVYFRVRLVADEETGTPEAFGIRLSNGYPVVSVRPLGAGGPGGGFVQLHQPNASNTWPASLPDVSTMCAGLSAPVGSGGVD